MTDAPERIWHSIDRNGKINGSPDAHVKPCEGSLPAYVEYVRADLLPQWQPIETAPKVPEHEHTTVGPMVVLASKYGHRAIGYWSDGRGALPAGWVNPHDHLIMIYWSAFTHWMPLPAPPTE